jgi:hypothetical protein
MNKSKDFLGKINKLNNFHYENSSQFRKIIDLIYPLKKIKILEDIPFIPAKLFKELELKSIPNKKIFKILNSSGTSSGKPSKIYLDKDNARTQTLVLNKIVTKIIGKKRLPMLIIDEKKIIQDPSKFDAKTAAIIGFSMFGSNHQYLIKDGSIDYENLNIFLDKFAKQKFLIFGFTSLVYEQLINKLDIKKIKSFFENSILIHGGGWKKMEKIKVSNKIFKRKLNKFLKINHIINYYGLIEQTGSIFFECSKCGCFTPSEYSEVLIRDKNFKVLPKNKKGFIQLLSILPKSYPGHSILTEDIGQLINNNCKFCKIAKKFKVYGRAEQSEIRGCSDV